MSAGTDYPIDLIPLVMWRYLKYKWLFNNMEVVADKYGSFNFFRPPMNYPEAESSGYQREIYVSDPKDRGI